MCVHIQGVVELSAIGLDVHAELRLPVNSNNYKEQEAFEKCWAHSPLRAVLHCHSPGVATVALRLRIDVHDDDDDNNDNA